MDARTAGFASSSASCEAARPVGLTTKPGVGQKKSLAVWLAMACPAMACCLLNGSCREMSSLASLDGSMHNPGLICDLHGVQIGRVPARSMCIAEDAEPEDQEFLPRLSSRMISTVR